MTEVFSFREGDAPLLISIPHDGHELAPGQAERMTPEARALPDTDWHVQRLYSFAGDLGASVLAANYSRYVVDLNRPADDTALYPGQLSTGLCPADTFSGAPIYQEGMGVTEEEQADRVQTYWQPYHACLATTLSELRERHGHVLLWDAHSIAGEVPLLFEGVLPDLNIGTNGGTSCGEEPASRVMAVAEESGFSAVLNGRFRGGFITRNYGTPADGIHAIQLELTQRNYMGEGSFQYDEERAKRVVETIRNMLAEALFSLPSANCV